MKNNAGGKSAQIKQQGTGLASLMMSHSRTIQKRRFSTKVNFNVKVGPSETSKLWP